VAASLGKRARTVVADASDEDELRRALLDHGSLDHIVVAVSAGARAGGINDTPPQEAQAAFGRFWTSYAALHLAPSVLPPTGRLP
jgi:hypothetical protein